MKATILVPTDFSEDANAALRYAGMLAHVLSADICIATVLPSSLLPHADDVAETSEPHTHQQLNSAGVEDANIVCTKRFLRGNPPDEILKLADELHATMIVMGTHGQTNDIGVAMGSIAQAIVHRATCTVLNVKTPRRLAP